MGSVNDEITRISAAKYDINAAIIESGGPGPETTEDKIDTYAARIRAIPEAVFSAFNVDQIGYDETYIKWVKQENGKISAAAGGFVDASSPGLLHPPTSPMAVRISPDDYILAAKRQDDNKLRVEWYLPLIYNVMTGATLGLAGTSGLVPQPAAGELAKYLRGDGTWAVPTDTKVTQMNTATNVEYRVLLSYYLNDTQSTAAVRKSNKLIFNPSTGVLTVNGSIIGNIDSDNINSLSTYSINTAISAITQDDSLNSALGKLEYKANLGVWAKLWIDGITEADTDATINKWDEIVTFVNGITADADILGKFVTTDTTQEISGQKTFTNKIFIDHKLSGGAYIVYTNQRHKADSGGWADSILDYRDAGNNIKARFGVKGLDDLLSCIYLGLNTFDSLLNLQIYNNKVSFGKINLYETLLHIDVLGASGDNFNLNYSKPYTNKVLVIGPNKKESNSLFINRAGIQSWNTDSDTPAATIPSLYIQGAGGDTWFGGGIHPLKNNTLALGSSTYKWKTLNGYNIGCDNNNVLISARFPGYSSTDITSIDPTVDSSTIEKYFRALCKYAFALYKSSSATNGAVTLIGLARPGSTGTLIMSLYVDPRYDWTTETNMPRYCSALFTSLDGNLYIFGSTNDGQWYFRKIIPGYLTSLNIPSYSHLLSYYSGYTSVGTSSGNAKEGSNTYLFFSYPTGATSVSNSLANIISLRLLWSTSWLHEIFASPNQRQLWHRWIENGTPKPWSRIVLEDNDSENFKYKVSISGNADTATKASRLANTSNVGSTLRPVYFTSLGVPTACTWGTVAGTSTTAYHVTGVSSTTGGINYNPNVYLKSNALYASNGFYEESDERLKNLLNDVEVDLNKLKQIPKKYFTWKTGDSSLHIGTSAQEIQKLYPELVSTADDGTLSVAYDKLSILALKGIDVLYDLVLDLKSEIKELKCKLNECYGG